MHYPLSHSFAFLSGRPPLPFCAGTPLHFDQQPSSIVSWSLSGAFINSLLSQPITEVRSSRASILAFFHLASQNLFKHVSKFVEQEYK
jgi:hypothetical protein